VVGRLGANLTVIETVVGRTHVLDDQAPLVRPLVVVDADARVADERKQPDRQRVNVVMATPRDLHMTCHVTAVFMSAASRDQNAIERRSGGSSHKNWGSPACKPLRFSSLVYTLLTRPLRPPQSITTSSRKFSAQNKVRSFTFKG